MRWLSVVAVVVGVVLVGLAGLTAGINLNPASTVQFVPNWGSVGDWLAGIAGLMTFVVASRAMNVWRTQEKQRLILLWKADLIDYTYTLPHLKQVLTYKDDPEQVGRIADKFSACIKSYLLMIEYLTPDRLPFYQSIWNAAHDAHSAYISGEGSREATKDAFVKAYLNKFL